MDENFIAMVARAEVQRIIREHFDVEQLLKEAIDDVLHDAYPEINAKTLIKILEEKE